MPAKFPRKRHDGTFSVEIVFASTAPPRREEVEAWLQEWISSNGVWIREWRGAEDKVVQTETLRLAEAFLSNPRPSRWDDGEYVVHLDGASVAPFWKDWMVNLIGDVTARFPALTFQTARDSQELDAMTEVKTIEVILAGGSGRALSVEVATSPHSSLLVRCLDAVSKTFEKRDHVFEDRDLFEALTQLRSALEAVGAGLLCQGARREVYPSGMSRSMSSGERPTSINWAAIPMEQPWWTFSAMLTLA